MDKDIEHAEKALACIDKMKEGLSELVALLDIADDTFGEMDRLETYKSINCTLGRWQENMRASSMNKVSPSHRRCKEEVNTMQYFDKNGVEIKAGMTIRMEDGSLELVYDTTDSYGNPDLGINASNEEYLELHPFASREFYSLCNFDMRYTEVVDDQTVAENNFEQSM